jgi:prefoldin subunit 5
MYDEIREEFYSMPEVIEPPREVVESYESLVEQIEFAKNAYEDSMSNFYDTNERIKRETLAAVEGEMNDISNEISELESELESLESEKEDISSIISDIDDRIEELENERSDYEIGSDDEYKVSDEITELESEKENHEDDIRNIENRMREIEDQIENLQSNYSLLEEKYDEIESIDIWEMCNSDIDWSEYPICEDDIYNDIEVPTVDWYDDYTEFMEEHGYGGKYSDTNNDIYMYILGETNEYSAEELLASHGWYHPNVVMEQ